MKKTARVIITSKCDRKCPGCCNSKLDYTSLAKVIGGITALKDYEEEIFFSCREAERLYNLPPNSVGKVCRGELESIYGYRFGYL